MDSILGHLYYVAIPLEIIERENLCTFNNNIVLFSAWPDPLTRLEC